MCSPGALCVPGRQDRKEKTSRRGVIESKVIDLLGARKNKLMYRTGTIRSVAERVRVPGPFIVVSRACGSTRNIFIGCRSMRA